MEIFYKEYFANCKHNLSVSETVDDAFNAWMNLCCSHPELDAIIALPKYDRALPLRDKVIDSYFYKKYLVHYFSKENLYFINDDLIRRTIKNKQVKIPIDYTLAFDTNLASYIKTIVQGGELRENQSKVIALLDQLLNDDLNCDHLFYLTENTKSVYISALTFSNSSDSFEFWKNLNKKFRWNLVSLELFRGIDCKKYKKTSSPESIFNFRSAVRNCIKYAFDFYASESGKQRTIKLLRSQRIILLYLLQMYSIQFSSNKGGKRKIDEFFHYIQNNIGVYLERETVIAHKYFMDRKNVPFLNQVNLGFIPKKLLKVIDNIAWDMMAPRFMEELIVSGGEGSYMIPFFLTFDNELRDLLNSFPIKSTIINSQSGALIPIPEMDTYNYFLTNGCKESIEWFFSEESIEKRRSNHLYDLRSINLEILKEYRKLRKIYLKKS